MLIMCYITGGKKEKENRIHQPKFLCFLGCSFELALLLREVFSSHGNTRFLLPNGACHV